MTADVVTVDTKAKRTRKPKAPPAPAKPGFTVDGDLLASLAGPLLKVAGGRFTMPILGNLEAIVGESSATLRGTDLETTVTVTVPVTDATPGRFLAPAKLFGAAVKAQDGPVAVTVSDDGLVTIAAGEFVGNLRPLGSVIDSLATDDFPLDRPVEGATFTVDALALRNAIKRTLPAASTDDARQALTGILFDDDGTLVSTDSYRLVVATTDLGLPKMLVPASALALLQSAATGSDDVITVTVGDRAVGFATGTTSIVTRLIDSDYPKYQQLLPASFAATVQVDRVALIDAIDRAKILLTGEQPVRLAISADRMIVSAIAQDVGDADEGVPATLTGVDEVKVAFNPKYLLDGLKTFEGPVVTLLVNDPMKPVVVTVDGESSRWLQMPVRRIP